MPEMVSPEEYANAADALVELPGVLSADVLDRDPRTERPMLELTVGPGYVRVLSRVLRRIAEHDLGVCDVRPQGVDGHWRGEGS